MPTKRRQEAQAQVDPFMEPVAAAKAASLRYVSDEQPGLTRRRSGKGFTYLDSDGQVIKDPSVLARIRALAIPPAWTDVWICPLADGHLQATGRDARGRKQYRYHRRWTTVRDDAKYGRMILFGTTLPRIRARVQEDLDRPGLPRDKLLAMIVRLLETTFIRVGNEEYARTNHSFGLTTLLNRHVEIDGARLRFHFRGKGGKPQVVQLTDRRLARLVKRCRDLPGQDLFQYLDDEGNPQPISSTDVNDYLRAITDQEFTAKDFRTWGGTLLAIRNLSETTFAASETADKSVLAAAVALVAEHLGNTPAICRKCYIHPAVLEAYRDASLYTLWTNEKTKRASRAGLDRQEAALLRFLEKQAKRGTRELLGSVPAKRAPKRRATPVRSKAAPRKAAA
jgi:DNA topoisomerase-1